MHFNKPEPNTFLTGIAAMYRIKPLDNFKRNLIDNLKMSYVSN